MAWSTTIPVFTLFRSIIGANLSGEFRNFAIFEKISGFEGNIVE